MAETKESIRGDSAQRQIEGKQINDWSGKRFVPPRGTTLPAISTALPGELFVLVKDADIDQLYIFDNSVNNWSTVGP